MTAIVHHGKLEDILPTLPPDSIDSCVTDTPYHLTAGKKTGEGNGGGFMGMAWDGGDVAFRVETWREVFRVLKPGAHLLAFGGTRTHHRMVCAIEDAGFEIRDEIDWVFAQGFPKSLNLDGEWDGWGTALKPAKEPICMARKPLIGTVVENVAAHRTGAINIDGCRVPVSDDQYAKNCSGDRGHAENRVREMAFGMTAGSTNAIGRWPANIIHDGSQLIMDLFPDSDGQLGRAKEGGEKNNNIFGAFASNKTTNPEPRIETEKSSGRFFYCAKTSKADREDGCDALPEQTAAENVRREPDSAGMNSPRAGAGRTSPRRNGHPTVKPTALMRYLCRLITPPGGTVLDPFTGSGSTGRGAVLEGFSFVGIEMTDAYLPIARARIEAAEKQRVAEAAQ